MSYKHSAGLMVVALLLSGCGGNKPADVSETERKVGDTEQQLQQAKAQAGTEQKVADLEKQLADLKKQLAQSKGEPGRAATGTPSPVGSAPATASADHPLTPAGEHAPATTAANTATPEAPRAPVPPPPPPKPKEYVIPAGTPISIRTTTAISTKTANSGETFAASLTRPITIDGEVLARSGAEVSGIVVQSDPGGRVKGKASISVALRSIRGTHGPIRVETSSHEALAPSSMKKDVVRGGIMTGVGAAIGAIAGGGSGAAIGAGVGAGAGVGTALATKGAPAQIPAESVLTLRTKAPVTITVQP